MEITINQAENRLPDLMKRALSGEEIILSNNGKFVKLTPLESSKSQNKKRQPGGSWKGKVQISSDFDEICTMFEGNDS